MITVWISFRSVRPVMFACAELDSRTLAARPREARLDAGVTSKIQWERSTTAPQELPGD
jgi:hypothetical protein